MLNKSNLISSPYTLTSSIIRFKKLKFPSKRCLTTVASLTRYWMLISNSMMPFLKTISNHWMMNSNMPTAGLSCTNNAIKKLLGNIVKRRRLSSKMLTLGLRVLRRTLINCKLRMRNSRPRMNFSKSRSITSTNYLLRAPNPLVLAPLASDKAALVVLSLKPIDMACSKTTRVTTLCQLTSLILRI